MSLQVVATRSGLLGGASDSESDESSAPVDGQDSESDVLPANLPAAEEPDEADHKDESIVHVQAAMLSKLKAEVTTYASSLTSMKRRKGHRGRRCELCPFRSFADGKPGRLRHHVLTYHVEKVKYCASGNKQLRVACAIYDDDCYRGRIGGQYLMRSAELLRSTVTPSLSTSCNSIDKQIRLVYTGTGPAYHNIAELKVRNGLIPDRMNTFLTFNFC